MGDWRSALLVVVLTLGVCASTGGIPREPFYDMRVPESAEPTSFVSPRPNAAHVELSVARHARR